VCVEWPHAIFQTSSTPDELVAVELLPELLFEPWLPALVEHHLLIHQLEEQGHLPRP
jgi:hypothetical protein